MKKKKNEYPLWAIAVFGIVVVLDVITSVNFIASCINGIGNKED